MRKLMVFALAVSFLGSMGLALAADTPAAPAKHSAKHEQLLRAKGEISSVGAGSLVIKEAGKDVTFTTNDMTKVKAHNKAAKLEDLKAGDTVLVKYAKEGDTMIAHDIVLTPAKAAAGAAKTEAAPAKTEAAPAAAAPKK